jgi:tetratricopeptide (TPR) repeat protein
MASSARIDELRKKFDENPRRYFAPLANEYRKAGDLEQAIFICQEYLPQQPGHMSGHIVYGQALFELNRFDEARAVFETALSLDPENLIALRHLGDIARQAGDSKAARTWYQRVLEADPRNEEIAQIMMSLLGTPARGQTPVSSSAPTPLSTPAVASFATPATEQRTPPVSHAPMESAFDVEKSVEHTDLTIGAELSALPERTATPTPPRHTDWGTMSTPSALGEELLDLDDFSVGGVPLSSVSPSTSVDEPADASLMESPPPRPVASATPSTSTEPEPQTPAGTFNFGDETGDFEAGAFAMTSPPADLEESTSPPEEFASDITLGLPDDGTSPSLSDVSDSTLSGLETFSEGIAAFTSPPSESLELDSFFETTAMVPSEIAEAAEPEPEPEPLYEEFPEPAPTFEAAMPVFEPETAPIDGGHDGLEVPPEVMATPEPAEPAFEVEAEAAVDEVEAEPEPEAFVTETMAELYLQQGHIESALDIYQRLVAQRPSDPQLRERLRAIEQRIRGEAEATPEAAMASQPDTHVGEPAAPAGPTIREFLSGLFRSQGTFSQPEPVGEPEMATPEPTQTFGQADETSSTPTPTSAAVRVTPTASATISGSIDALFSGADASAGDANAASTLAQAFAAEGPETAPLQGVPAHKASSELSLDHVFKLSQSSRSDSENDGFSFDQFFADDVSDTGSKSGAEPPSPTGEGGDDIAQFNNWLNGLKKT